MLSDSDPDIRSLAQEEHAELSQRLTEQLAAFPSALLPPSETVQFSALMELRAGVGGDESTLFLSELLRMYSRLAQENGFVTELVSFSPSDPAAGAGGGGKEAILEVKGDGAYDKFRFESGVHRVQRVPATETKGRLHTSTVAVLVSPSVLIIFDFQLTEPNAQVLPSSDEKESQNDVDIVDPKDVRTDVMRAQGAGGQVRLPQLRRAKSAIPMNFLFISLFFI